MAIRVIAALLIVTAWSPCVARAADAEASGTCFLSKDGCSITGLRTPTSPAFMIIGVSPTQVARPQTPQDVALTVFDLATTSGGLPRNLALEIAPYWLFTHPALTFDEYVRPRLLPELLYNASISVATAPVTGSTAGADLSVGIRTHVFFDLATTAQRRDLDEARQVLLKRDQLRAAALAFDRFGCGGQSLGPACPALTEELRRLLGSDQIDAASVLSDTEARLVADAKRVQDALTAREGVVVSLAVAAAGRTPAEKAISWNEPTRLATWFDAGYESPLLDALAVVRYTHVNQDGALALLDAGARVVWVAPRFSLSAEYLRRSVVSRPPGSTFTASDRATATVEFPLFANVWLSATVGQDAATETRPSAVITLLGVSFQASRDRQVALK